MTSYTQAFQLFNDMILVAEEKLFSFTTQNVQDFHPEQKADKTFVTACDQYIDQVLSDMAKQAGFQIVSEEGAHVLDIVKSENYLTIDPIDGTLGYIDYCNDAIAHQSKEGMFSKDLGARSDFSLLLGIVQDGEAKYGACFNYITKEKILIDGDDPKHLVRENNRRNYVAENALYLDQRMLDDPITQKLLEQQNVTPFTQATFGLKTLYTILNSHQNAVTSHRVQSAGLWDVLPTAVAVRAFGGEIYDDQGQPLSLTDYIVIPGNGATVIKGDKFQFVRKMLEN